MLCFRKFPVGKKFLDKREGEVSRFLLNFFCLKVTKSTEGEPSSLSLYFVYRNKLDERKG